MDFDIPIKEIERRKQVIRDVWEYKKVDHIPVMLTVNSNPYGYTMHEELLSKEKQLQLRLASVKRTLELIPDDYIPTMFANAKEFAIPVNSGIFQKYGPGMLHNCGPNPCVEHYLEHNPEICGADLSFKYSRDDLPKFKKIFRRKGILYLGMDFSSEEQTIADYQYIIDSLSPVVIAIPSVIIDEAYIKSGPQ